MQMSGSRMNFPKGVLVVSTPIDLSTGIVPVRVINLIGKPKSITKGARVGNMRSSHLNTENFRNQVVEIF